MASDEQVGNERTSGQQVVYWVVFAVILGLVLWLLWGYWDRSSVDDAGGGGDIAVATIPDVVGLTESEATFALDEAGFEVDTLELYDRFAEPGRVLVQAPEAGAEVAPGITVTIEIATGGEDSGFPDPRADSTRTPTVPDVVGTFQETAEGRLKSAGYIVSVANTYSEDFPPGKVVFQSPGAGLSLAEGSIVGIVVSLGKLEGATGTVPDVTGASSAAAKDRVEAAGFVYYAIPRPAPAVPGEVFEQWPAAGESAPLGSEVFVIVGE